MMKSIHSYMDSVLFLFLITLVIHAAYGLGVMRKTRAIMRGQMAQYEKRLHVMAHGLYTPLGSIRNFTELLGSGKVQKDQARMIEYTDIIDSNVVRMLETVRYYIDISRLENNSFDIFVRDDSLVFVVEERLHFYGSRALKASVVLAMRVAQNVPSATTFDSRAVSHMIDRMLSAMIERSHAGDTISVHVFVAEKGETIQGAAAKAGNGCVSDISAQSEKERMIAVAISSSRAVFDAVEITALFTDVTKELKTLGTTEPTAGELLHAHHIGLAVVKRWAEAHGGSSGAWLCREGSALFFALPQTSNSGQALKRR